MLRALACLACVVALAAQAQVYKWVDEKGVTHYTETPPPQDSKQIKVPTGGQAQEPAPEVKKDAPAATPAAGGDKAARCQFEKDQMKVLEGAKVTYKNDKGETVEADEARKESAKKLVQENIKRYCS